MTDEELTEEYAEGICKTCTVHTCRHNILKTCAIKESIKQAYLAGVKAGRPQWHDLRKDPNDLPKDNDEKLCFYEKGKVVARYDSEYSCWETYFNNFETVIASSVIIAWCELPQFTDKE